MYGNAKQTIMSVCEFCLENRMFINVSNYWFLRRRTAKEKCKQIKKSGQISTFKKMDILDNFNKVMVKIYHHMNKQ